MIADFTDARIVLEEVPHIGSVAVPIVQVLLQRQPGSVTLKNLRRNHRSVLGTVWYSDQKELIQTMQCHVIMPAEKVHLEFLNGGACRL